MLIALHHRLVPLVGREVSLGEKTKQTNQCNSLGLAAVEAAGRANGGRRRVPANLGNKKKKAGGWGATWSGQFAGWIPDGGAE